MSRSNELQKLKEDFLLKLDKEELKSYIDNLIKDYYNFFISNDNENLKRNVIELMRLPTLFENKYPNMSNYINYRLVVLSNRIFESIFNNRGDLYYPLEHTQIDSKSSNEEFRKNLFVYTDEEMERIQNIGNNDNDDFMDKL